MDVQELGNESTLTLESCSESGVGEDSQRPVRKKQVLTDAQKEHKRQWSLRRYQIRKEVMQERGRQSYQRHRIKNLKQKLEKRLSDPIAHREKLAAYRAANPDANKLKQRAWKAKNLEHVESERIAYLARRRELSKLRRAENPTRKLAENCRSRICHILKREKVTKSQSTFKFIGCTAEFFREFLEHQFTPQMNWSNYGIYWSVDHVIPISGFNLHDSTHLRNAFHYSNCRPLKVEENSEKNDTLPSSHQPLFL